MRKRVIRTNDIKKGIAALLAASMVFSHVEIPAFAGSSEETEAAESGASVKGGTISRKSVTLDLLSDDLREAALTAIRENELFDAQDYLGATSDSKKVIKEYEAFFNENPGLYVVEVPGSVSETLENEAEAELRIFVQKDEKMRKAMDIASASELTRDEAASSKNVEFRYGTEKDIILYEPATDVDTLINGGEAAYYKEPEQDSADNSDYELTGKEKITFMFVNNSDKSVNFTLNVDDVTYDKVTVSGKDAALKKVLAEAGKKKADEEETEKAAETTKIVEAEKNSEATKDAEAEKTSETTKDAETEKAAETTKAVEATKGETVACDVEEENGKEETETSAEKAESASEAAVEASEETTEAVETAVESTEAETEESITESRETSETETAETETGETEAAETTAAEKKETAEVNKTDDKKSSDGKKSSSKKSSSKKASASEIDETEYDEIAEEKIAEAKEAVKEDKDAAKENIKVAKIAQYTLDELGKIHYETEIDGFKVDVFASRDAFEISDPKLSVKKLYKPEENKSESETLSEAEIQELKNKDVYNSSQALDIHFTDFWGKEIEPSKSVKVRITLSDEELLKKIDAASLEVHHIKETDSTLKTEKVASRDDVKLLDENDETIADSDLEVNSEEVEETDENTVNVASAVAEFEVESFSVFAITWTNSNGSQIANIKVHYVDTEGNQIKISGREVNARGLTFDLKEGDIKLSDIEGGITGYTYVGARLNSLDEKNTITKLSKDDEEVVLYLNEDKLVGYNYLGLHEDDNGKYTYEGKEIYFYTGSGNPRSSGGMYYDFFDPFEEIGTEPTNGRQLYVYDHSDKIWIPIIGTVDIIRYYTKYSDKRYSYLSEMEDDIYLVQHKINN